MSGYLSPGTFFAGQYLILDRAGEGTSAVVYKVRANDSRDVYALKLWKGSAFQSEIQLRRFRLEAELNQRLDHPNIARIRGSGVHEGSAYLILEYLSGVTLAEHLAQSGPVSSSEFMAIASDLCAAMAHVHAAGIVHRDIKPSNLMYSSTGAIKLTDFGIARDRGDQLTIGALRGTAEYMSPEQFLGATVSPLSDIFSAGAVFYELLSGKRPFAGMSPAERCTAKVPALRSVAPHVPEPIAALIDACLENDPARRPASASALMSALTPSQPAPAAPPPPQPPRQVQAPLIRTLSMFLAQDPAETRDVVPVFLALVRRLAQIEAAGEVHDPVTPSTVRLRPDGTPEISSHAPMAVSDSTVVPMARYGAPEVLRAGSPRTPAARTSATLYSVGLVLYEILAGSKLFQREFEPVLAKRSELGWLEWQWNPAAKPTPVDKLVPSTPPELARILDRMLEKDPAKRPQSYAEVERAMQRLVLSTQKTEEMTLPIVQPAVASGKSWKPVAAGVGALLLTLFVIGIALQLMR